MPKILESEALVLANSIDAAAPEDRPWMLDVLTRYQSQQFDNGDPEWPTQAKQQAEAETRFRSMFDAPEKVPYDPGPYAKDPNAERASYANAAFIANRYNVEFGEAVDRRRFYMDDYAAKKGQKSGLDDMAFYNLAKGEVAETKLAEDTRLEGAKAALRGEDVIGSLQAWQGKNLDRLAGSTDFTKGYLKAKDQAGDYLPMADELLKLMESQTGQSNSARTFDTKAASRLDELAVELASMKPRERKQVYASIAARSEMAGYEQKGFWSQMLGELDKGLLRMSQTAPMGAARISGMIGGFVAGSDAADDRALSDEMARERGELSQTDLEARRDALGEIHDELASIVSGTVDPVRPTIGWLDDTIETGLIKGPSAVMPFMAATAALGPWGGGMLFTADFAEQNRRDLRAAGMDNDRAIQIGTVAAPLQAAVESLSNMLQLGKFTKLQSVLVNFTKPIGGGAGLALRYAQNTGISLATEYTEEQLQDNFIVPAVQEIVGALAADVPEVDWSFYKTRAAESTPELLSVLAPMALVFGGVMTGAQANLSREMTSNIDALKALNYSEAQATEIVAEKTEEGRIAKASSMWGVRAGDKTTLEEGARSLSERMRQLSGDVMAQQQELERRGILPRMLRATEDQWRLTFQDGSTAAYNSHAEADAARWTWTEDQLGKVHALTRETLSSMERNLDVKREIGVEFSPDARTAQDAVNDGVSVEQMSRRVKQGAALGDVAPDTAFDDAQAIDKATADSEGFLSSLRILGSSRNEFKDGVLRTTIRLWEGSNVLTLVEEKLEGDAKAIISEGRGRDWMLSRLRAYEETSGDKLFRDVPDEQLKDDDIIEAWSHLGQSYLVGRSTFGEPLQAKTMRRFGRLLMRAGFTGAMNSEASFFAAVASRAKKLGELQKAGKLGADLTAELEKQLGIDSQLAHEAGAEAEARQLIDTSGYSEETPGPNGETFALAPLAMFTTKEQRDYAFGDGRYTHPVTLKNGTRLSGETFDFKWSDTDKMPTFFGYTKSGAEITIQAQYVTPDMVATSRDSGKSANDLRDRLEKWHARRGTNGETFSLASSPLKGTTGAWMDRSGALTVLTGNDTHDSAANKLTGLSGMNGFDELLNNRGFLRLKQAGWAGDNRLYFNGAPTLAQRSALKRLNEDFGYSVIQDNGERGERVIFGGETFSLSRATPADASNVVQMPDGARLVGPTTFSIRAFHGTPHKVDKFSLDKIGTGEGAQAYGWGLYMAESRKVAEQYRKDLSGYEELTIYTKDGKKKGNDLDEIDIDAAKYLESGARAAGQFKHNTVYYAKQQAETAGKPDVVARIESYGRDAKIGYEVNRGNLYTVELLPDESEFLDWDKPLSEQSEKVKAAFSQLHKSNKSAFDYYDKTQSNKFADGSIYGSALYARLSMRDMPAGNDAQASSLLVSMGVKGIRFLDGNSRGAGDGTRNYVLFDENLVRILEENGKPVGETFSLRASDAEYMAAVEAGDMETAQRMVDAAAKAAGYATEAWHGSGSGPFSTFRLSEAGGIFVALDKKEAENFAVGKDATLRRFYIRGKYPERVHLSVDERAAANQAKKRGRDGIRVSDSDGWSRLTGKPVERSVNLLVFDRNNIKSADPVTRDESGNVIPLSKRFNPADNRITFSLRSGDFASRAAAMFSPFQRTPELRMAIARVAKERAMRLGAEWIEKAAVIRSASSINREVAFREADGFDRRMTAYLDSLTPNARQNLEFEPAALEDDPLISAMLDFGKLMSQSTAKREGKVNAKDGDYDGAPWIPPTWYSGGGSVRWAEVTKDGETTTYTKEIPEDVLADIESGAATIKRKSRSIPAKGGIMPDQMAQAMHDAGLLPDAYTDTLWDALASRIESSRKDKAAYREAVQAFRDAKKTARAEAKAEAEAWGERTKKTAGSPKAQRDMLKAALRTLDGILSAAPPEVRARVGGYVKLAGLATDEAMLQEIERRVAKLNVELSKWLKKEATEAIAKVFKKARAKAKGGKKPVGKIGAEAHEWFDLAESAFAKDEAETNKRIEEIQGRLDRGEIKEADEQFDAMQEVAILQTFGGWEAMDAGERYDALGAAEDMYKGSRADWLKKMEDRRAGDKASIESLMQNLGNRGLLSDKDAGAKAGGKRRGKVAEFIQTFGSDMRSWFHGSKLVDDLVRAERKSQNANRDAINQHEQDFADAVDAVLMAKGGKLAKRRARQNFIYDNTRPVHDVSILEGRVVEKETVKAEDARAIVDSKAKGYTPEQIAEMEDQLLWIKMAEAEKLPRRKTVSFNVIKNAGTRKDITLSQAEISWVLALHAQEKLRGALTVSGFDEVAIAELAKVEKPQMREVRAWMVAKLKAEHAVINRIYADMMGVGLPSITNYFPARFVHDGDVSAPVLGGAAVQNGSMKTGALRNRKNHTSPIALNFETHGTNLFSLFQSHAAEMEYWKNYAPLVREMKAVLSNGMLKEAFRAKHGDSSLADLNGWVQAIESGGLQDAHFNLAAANAMRGFLGRFAATRLSFKLGTALVNLSSGLNALLDTSIPFKDVMASYGRALFGGAKMTPMQALKSDALQRRLKGGTSPEQQFAKHVQRGSKPGFALDVMTAGRYSLGMVDTFAGSWAASASYDANFRMAKKARLSDADAHLEALEGMERTIATTFQPTETSNKSLSEASGNIAWKMVTIFLTEQRQKVALEVDVLSRALQGKATAGEVGRVVVVNHLLIGTFVWFVRAIAKDLMNDEDGDDDPAWELEDWIASVATGPLSGIPFVGSALNYGIASAIGGNAYRGSDPITGSLGEFNQGWRLLMRHDDGEDILKGLVKLWNGVAVLGGNDTAVAGAILSNAGLQIYQLVDNLLGED